MNSMEVKYDIIADAVYMKVGTGAVAKTIKMEQRFLVDMDDTGNVVGFEILDVSSQDQLVQALKNNVAAGIPISIVNNTPVAA